MGILVLLHDRARRYDRVCPGLQTAIGAGGAAFESSRNYVLVSSLRRVSLGCVQAGCVFKASGKALVALITDWGMASGDSSSHSIGAVACSGDSCPSSSLVIRLPRLRPILDIRNLEIAATRLLTPNLFGLGRSAHVRLDNVAIGLILEVDVRLVATAACLLVDQIQIVWSRVIAMIVLLNLLSNPRTS